MPHGEERWDYSETLFAGADMQERREVLGRLARLYVSIEGGPGTAHEAAVARSRGSVLVPVGQTGGFSAEACTHTPRPAFADEAAWRALGAPESTPADLAGAVGSIVERFIVAG